MHPKTRRSFVLILSLTVLSLVGESLPAQIQVRDLGLVSGFQDTWFGQHRRGRATVAADFDLDGRIDFYIGSPGDESFVIRNVTTGPDDIRFELAQKLVVGGLTWGGGAADYDNDGDYDLFVSVGGNEGIGLDILFKNLWIESGGTLRFVDVTAEAGIAGPLDPASGEPVPVASANAVWVDYDSDGWIDLFVNVDWRQPPVPGLRGRNVLWRNNSDGTFSDVTDDVGLGVTRLNTRHSTFFDIDNDGDADLWENNLGGANFLWRNLLVETGNADFEDVTTSYSSLPGQDLSFPTNAFASASTDLDQDGWQDLVVFVRGSSDCGTGGGANASTTSELENPYPSGHALFLNVGGTAFVNVAEQSGINATFPSIGGVMGCQVGDVTGDGVADIYVGNGGPPEGNNDQLYIADSPFGAVPHYSDRSNLIDFPAAEDGEIQYPPYPYRTHGTAFVDVDADGRPEILVANGGPVNLPDVVREPNRLFRLSLSPEPAYLKIRPVGDGTTVSRDAIGTRVVATVRQGGGPPRAVHGALHGGSAFSAQNGFEVFLGLADADTVDSLELVWPDGVRDRFIDGLAVNRSLVVSRDCGGGSCICEVTEGPEASCSDQADNDCDGFIDDADPDCG